MDNASGLYPSFAFVNILAGLALSLTLGWLAIGLSRRVGLMDLPGALPHKKHITPTPLAGGLTLALTLLVGLLLLNFSVVQSYWNIFLPALIIFAVGLWDDFKRLPARVKLAGQALAVTLLLALGTYVQIIPQGFLGLPAGWNMPVNYFITAFWMIGITNAMNFIDSMDGLVVGISGVTLSFLILVTLASPQVELLRLLTLMLGSCIGLFFYNSSPAKFFLGDSGAQSFGFLLAAICIVYTPVNLPQATSWFLPILVLGVPIFDTCLVVFSRMRRGIPFYKAGQDHTYHRLVVLGLDSNRAVAVMHMMGIVMGSFAFIALSLSPLGANMLFAFVLLLGLVAFILLDKKHA